MVDFLIWHTFFIKNDEFSLSQYLSIDSLFLTNNIKKLIIYYYYIPFGKLWDKLKNKYIDLIELEEIKIPEKLFNKFKLSIILDILYKHGGIYFEKNTLFLNKLDFIYDNINNDISKELFIITSNYSILYSNEKNITTNNIFKILLEKSENNFDNINEEVKNNIKIIDVNNDLSLDNIKYILFNEITDYTFGQYFHIINNCSYLSYYNNDIFNNDYDIEYNELFNKITIFNLLVRFVYTKKYQKHIDDDILYIKKHKFDLINNIDKIYWINLDESIDRKKRMEKMLEFINIENERVKAVNGYKEQNINKKYFISLDEKYPNNCNKEYAILLSHLNCIEKIVNSYNDENTDKHNISIIFEDDLSYDFIDYWEKEISEIIKELPDNWEILMLGYFSLNIKYDNPINKWNNEWSALSYLVNTKNIKNNNTIKLLKNDENKWICNSYDIMVSDNYIFSKFNTYIYKYPYFTFPNDNDSTLHDDHLQYHKIYKLCNYITLENVVNKFYLDI